jgi:hypothetical protein
MFLEASSPVNALGGQASISVRQLSVAGAASLARWSIFAFGPKRRLLSRKRLNQRPRKTLGFETPADKLQAVLH